MASEFWYKQTTYKPLFEDLIWSRPENKRHAGKLLIVGGNLHGFAAPAEAYREAEAAGIGAARVILPDAIKKIVGSFLENAEFGPSTPSGSFSQQALAELLVQTGWADGLLLAGDLGRNSETAILLEKFISKYSGQLTLTKDAIDYFKDTPLVLAKRPETTLALSMAQLQKFMQNTQFPKPITFSIGLVQLVEILSEFTKIHPCNLIVKHLDNLVVASGGEVSSTLLKEDMEIWRVKVAAHAAVWWLQNQSKPFEALTTAVYDSVVSGSS